MTTFGSVHFREEYFGLPTVRGISPLQVPSFGALQFAGGFDMGEGDWGGEKFGVEGRRGLWDGDNRTLFGEVVSSLVAIMA